ncbi:ABC transporter permease [Nonomuraea sp. NPDC026600]|uniref:ABC transporter permease n=1 Tax=Nonomuraea sp. NPDC026600 TaxID=3155363 RepID=UPI0033DB9E68
MTLMLAWNNVRTNVTGFAASFVAVVMAVMFVSGSGLLVVAAGADDELNGIMGLLVLSALMSGFTSIFVVSGTLSLHVLRQRRTWGLLRSVGMTPRQVRRLVGAEALVMAVLASAAQQRLMPWPRAVAGVVALAGGVVLLWLVPQVKPSAAVPTGMGATMALCVGASALGPLLLRGMGWMLGGPVALLDPGTGMLARSSLITQPRRAMAVASPVMLTVALACTFLFAVATSDAAAGVTRIGPSAWVAPALVGSAVAYTMISVLNATAMSMAERAEEFRLLRSAGAQPGQLARAVCWESLIVTCAGALLGTGIAAASLTAMGKAVTGELWFAYSLPQYLGLVAVCAVSGLIAGLLSTRKARNGPLVS